MYLPLLGVGRRPDPEPGLDLELGPCRQHRLAWSAASQHDEAKAVARWLWPISHQRVAEGRQFRRAEEALAAFFGIAPNALAWVSLRAITPGRLLAGHRLQRKAEHLRENC